MSLITLMSLNYEQDSNPKKRRDVTCFIEYKLEGGIKCHTTITYLGDQCPPQGERIGKWLNEFKDLPIDEAIEVRVIRHDKFGPNQDIPVLVVDFLDQRIKQLFIEYHHAYGVVSPGMTSFIDPPNFHISLQYDDLKPFRDLEIGTILTATSIGIKRLGNCEPFYIKRLFITEEARLNQLNEFQTIMVYKNIKDEIKYLSSILNKLHSTENQINEAREDIKCIINRLTPIRQSLEVKIGLLQYKEYKEKCVDYWGSNLIKQPNRLESSKKWIFESMFNYYRGGSFDQE